MLLARMEPNQYSLYATHIWFNSNYWDTLLKKYITHKHFISLLKGGENVISKDWTEPIQFVCNSYMIQFKLLRYSLKKISLINIL